VRASESCDSFHDGELIIFRDVKQPPFSLLQQNQPSFPNHKAVPKITYPIYWVPHLSLPPPAKSGLAMTKSEVPDESGCYEGGEI
jgi:hypothetical protein